MPKLTILLNSLILLISLNTYGHGKVIDSPRKPCSFSLNYGAALPVGQFRNQMQAKAGDRYDVSGTWFFNPHIGAVLSFQRLRYGLNDVQFARMLHPAFSIPDDITDNTVYGWRYSSVMAGFCVKVPHNKANTLLSVQAGDAIMDKKGNFYFRYAQNDTLHDAGGTLPGGSHNKGLVYEIRLTETYPICKWVDIALGVSFQSVMIHFPYASEIGDNVDTPWPTPHFRDLNYDTKFNGFGVQAGLVFHRLMHL